MLLLQDVTNLSEAIGKAMEDMTNCTQMGSMQKPPADLQSKLSLFMFVTSAARTNLEIELVQRGGSLVTIAQEPPIPLLPKRDCISKFSKASVTTNANNAISLQFLCCTC